MGTSNTALFSDDTACDVRDEFIERLSAGATSADATQALIRGWADAINDPDDGPVFWLALAATQWKYGCLGDEVLARAIDVIDNGSDLKRWEGSSALARRRSLLMSLREKLISTQPTHRKPRRKKLVVVPSTKVISPDGLALATAYSLVKSPHPNAPRMQVIVEMVVSGSKGGGGVMVADCEYTEVSLTWIDSETLQIAYPASATLRDQKSTCNYCGRVIKLVYQLHDV